MSITSITTRPSRLALAAVAAASLGAVLPSAASALKIERAGRSMVATVAFTAVDDAVCEDTETARVRVVKRTRRKGARRDHGTVTIRDNDCDTPTSPKPAPAPAPEPAPAPAPPAPTGSSTRAAPSGSRARRRPGSARRPPSRGTRSSGPPARTASR